MGMRKVPLVAGIVAGVGLFVACAMQLMAGKINMAVIFGVAGIAVIELGVMVSVIRGMPILTTSRMVGRGVKAMNVDRPTEFTMVSHEQPSDSVTGVFVAPQPSMGHMDLRMNTASSQRENTGIYIESEELMRGGSLQKLVYGNKKKQKKVAAKSEAKRPAKMEKAKSK